MTTNIAAAKEFYEKVLGWQYTEQAMGEHVYTFIKIATDDKPIGGMWEIPNHEKAQLLPRWTSYILVEDLEETVNKAIEHGATVKVPITKLSNFGRIAVIVDPANAAIALLDKLD
ncbi:VOC family protein [Legionella beliardensis]|nr:VOC family protein [Legionella beliardensis]